MKLIRRILPLTALTLFVAGAALAGAKSVVLFIGDGMGPEQVKAASIKFHGADGKLAMQTALVTGSIGTRSMDSDVTDSAAAGTALATGRKTNNGVISMSAGGSRLKTILEACRDEGKATGLVATSGVTHATPASFAAHVESRSMENEIAAQMIQARVNVIFGGGKGFFTGAAVSEGSSWVGMDVLGEGEKKIFSTTDTMNWPEYREIERSFLAPPGALQASVWLWHAGGKAKPFIDDVSLFEADEKGKPTGDNLLANGDFESKKADGWTDWGGLAVKKDGDSHVLTVDNQGGGAQQAKLKPGSYYAFSYRGRMHVPETKEEKIQPWEAADRAGYRKIEKKEDLARVRGKYVLGLFKDGALEATEDEPSLAEMTARALELLDRDRDGFFLMVEGSQIDWACHANDEPEYLKQMASFDSAVGAALAFAKGRDDVLVVVTADHETGGMKVEGDDKKSLKIKFTSDGHTGVNVPLFAFGPGAEAFAGEMENTDVAKKMAEALEVSF